MREHGVPQFTVDGHRPVGAFDVLGVSSRPSSATPTCSRRSTWPASRCWPPIADERTRSCWPVGTPRSTPSRSPTSSTPPCSVTVSRRCWDHRPRPGVEGRRAPRWPRWVCCCGWPATGGVYVPRFYDVHYLPDGRIQRVVPNRPGVPVAGAQAHRDGPRRVALPEAAAGAAGRERARADERGDLPRLHPGLPVLPGRDDHPAGAGALDRRDRADGRAAGWRPPASRRSGLLSLSSADHSEIAAHQAAGRPLRGHQHRAVPAEHPGRRLQHRPGQRAVPERSPLRARPSRPRAAASGSAR